MYNYDEVNKELFLVALCSHATHFNWKQWVIYWYNLIKLIVEKLKTIGDELLNFFFFFKIMFVSEQVS